MGSGIQLRVLENQLVHQTGDLNDFLQWITDNAGRKLGWSPIPTELAPFRFIDDVQQKAMLMQLNVADGTPWISKTTLGKAFDVDPVEERKKRKQEALDDARAAAETQIELQKRQSELGARSRAQAQLGQQGVAYDPQQMIAQADGVVEQLMPLDEGTRRSQMHQLQTTDLPMYALVKERMANAVHQQNQAAISVSRTGQDPTAGGADMDGIGTSDQVG
jgi:hypothetical protein